MVNKDKVLKDAMEAFEFSGKEVDDVMALFIAVSTVTKQGDGLGWNDVRTIVETHLDKYGVPVV
jgi:hypothetical protein